VLRALVVEPAGNLWGSERALLDFLGSVAGSPWQIAVCCPPTKPIVERLAGLPVAVFPTFVSNLHRKSKLQRLRATAGLLAAGLRHRPQLLHVNQAGATRIAMMVGRVLHIPVIAHVRLAEDVAYLKSLECSANDLPLVICVSQFIRNLFEDWNLDSGRRLTVLYDPYLPHRAWEGAPPADVLGPKPMLACVGRLTRSKGQHVLLQAISHLKEEGTPVHGHFFGTGDAGESFSFELAKLADKLGIADQIDWHGYQEEIPSSIVGATALVCPSYAESLGRVVFEAWDAGVIPLAWAGSGGPPEVIQASEAGVLYEHQTGSSLARALQSVLAMTPQTRRQMVENGRQWLFQNCDPQAYGEGMLALWQDVARLA
jgi:glycosyltransferase involved in cell wall biosynthesis